jgi:hypothetical protein
MAEALISQRGHRDVMSMGLGMARLCTTNAQDIRKLFSFFIVPNLSLRVWTSYAGNWDKNIGVKRVATPLRALCALCGYKAFIDRTTTRGME